MSVNKHHGGSTGGRYATKDPEGMQQLMSSIQAGCDILIEDIHVKGKFMWWTLTGADDVWHMWCTYGMSGQWTTSKPDKHSAITVWVEGPLAVHFRDPRHFGTVKFVKGHEKLAKKLATLGPDMLSAPPGSEEFVRIVRKHDQKNVCEVLMNQGIVSGVGNYVKCEALWLARIDPRAVIVDIPDSCLLELHDQIHSVMKASYESGGATIRSYRNPDGAAGQATQRFYCYGRDQDIEGNLIETLKTPDGRTTHWAPALQTLGSKAA